MFTKPPSSLLEEIDSFIPSKQRDRVVESRAVNVIGAAINVIKLFEQMYGPEEAEDLTKKFLLSIKTKESKKFVNKLRSSTKTKKE